MGGGKPPPPGGFLLGPAAARRLIALMRLCSRPPRAGRLAYSTDSFVRCGRFPGGAWQPGSQRHCQRSGDDGRVTAISHRRHDPGRGSACPSLALSSKRWWQARARPACRSGDTTTKVTATASKHQHQRHRHHPAGARSAWSGVAGRRGHRQGELGVHGIAILSVREGLEFGGGGEATALRLNGADVTAMPSAHLAQCAARPTRYGRPLLLNEIAQAARVGIAHEERSCRCRRLWPQPATCWAWTRFMSPTKANCCHRGSRGSRCGFYHCNAPTRWRPGGDHRACHCPPGVVVARTGIGGRALPNDMQVGEQLLRIFVRRHPSCYPFDQWVPIIAPTTLLYWPTAPTEVTAIGTVVLLAATGQLAPAEASERFFIHRTYGGGHVCAECRAHAHRRWRRSPSIWGVCQRERWRLLLLLALVEVPTSAHEQHTGRAAMIPVVVSKQFNMRPSKLLLLGLLVLPSWAAPSRCWVRAPISLSPTLS